MKTKINIKRELQNMENKNIKVIISIDKENKLCTCDDGNEYPLLDRSETLTIEELQRQLDSAKSIVCNILKETIEDEAITDD